MKVEIEDLEKNQKAITIEIPAAVVTRKINDSYRQVNATSKIRGFRPGKIPKNILRVHYWGKIKSQVINELVPETLQQAIEEKKLQIVGNPEFKEQIELKENAPLFYTVIVTTWPHVDLPENYKEIEIEKETAGVTDENVLNTLKEFQNQQAKYKVVADRPIKEGDQVVIDYTSLDVENNLLENKKDVVVEVGSNQFLPILNTNLVGMNKNEEKEFEETFPIDFANKTLADKRIKFKVLIREIKEKNFPEIDDDFAKDLGDYTLESLKGEIRENLQKKFAQEAQKKMKNALMNKLLEMASVEPPEIMIEDEMETMLQNIENELAGQGKKLIRDGSKFEEVKADLRKTAINRVKTSLILYELANREGIEVDAEEVDHQIYQLAKIYKENADTIKKSFKNEIEKKLREQKTLDFLLEHTKKIKKEE